MTRRKSWMIATGILGAVAGGATARAQSAPDADEGGGAPTDAGGAPGSGAAASPPPPPADQATAAPPPIDVPPSPARPAPEPAAPPDPPLAMPVVISTPTGWLLPAAVLYSRTGVDTGGGVTSDNRVGLGDVAEFGVSSLSDVAARPGPDPRGATHHIEPYVAATFRMGLQEDRLFAGQPGLVLGFRKSFERSYDGYQTRIAELTVVASERLGERAAIHVGAAFWDASLQGGGLAAPITLHGASATAQLRAFAGVEVRPFPRSQVMIEWGYAPVFCYACTDAPIRLEAELAWGVRYQVTRSVYLESGVRVPEIGDADLLGAQIFGNVTFTSFALAHAIDAQP